MIYLDNNATTPIRPEVVELSTLALLLVSWLALPSPGAWTASIAGTSL